MCYSDGTTEGTATVSAKVLENSWLRQWRGESEAAGRQPANGAPSGMWLLYLLVWNMRHAVGTTCKNHRSLCNAVGYRGRYKPPSPQQVQGTKSLEAPKNLHLTVPKTGI